MPCGAGDPERPALLLRMERWQVLDVLRGHPDEQRRVIAALQEADLDEHVVLQDALRMDDHADQLALVEEDVPDLAEPLSVVAEHDVLVCTDLDLAGNLAGLLDLRAQPRGAEQDADGLLRRLGGADRGEVIAEIGWEPAHLPGGERELHALTRDVG